MISLLQRLRCSLGGCHELNAIIEEKGSSNILSSPQRLSKTAAAVEAHVRGSPHAKVHTPLFNSALPPVLNDHFCWDHGYLYHSPALSHGPGRSADIHDDGER